MTPEQVSGVVLAAGPSRRFGRRPPKQLARLGGRMLVRRIVEEAIASRLSQVIVVVGFAADPVERALADFAVEIVRNPDFAAGQSSSVRAGLEAVDPSAAAAMFLPVDQPRLTADVIDALLEQRRRTGAVIVVPAHAGHRGAPAVIGRELFAELRTIEGDAGGRQIFAAHAGDIVELELPSGEPLEDIDRPVDLERLGG